MGQEAAPNYLDSLLDSCIIEGVDLTEPIGSGAYAKVYRGGWKGIPVAVKRLHDVFFDATVAEDHQVAMRGTFEKEIHMNMRLRHPNVIQFLGVCYAPEDGQRRAPMMVMELMETTLEKRLIELRLKDGAKMALHEVVNVAADVAAGLVYLHEQVPNPIAHRDLAPKNILLSASGRAKLADLGVAKAFDASVRHTMGPGTPAFMPPEVHLTKNYSPSPVDVYSFGVTLLEMCSGVDSNPSDLLRVVDPSTMQCAIIPERERRAASFITLGSNHLLEELILACLASSSEARPKAREVLAYLNRLKESEEYTSSLTAALAAKAQVSPKSCEACKRREEESQARLREKDLQVTRLQEEIENLKQIQRQQLAFLRQGVESFMVHTEKQSELPVQEVDGATQSGGTMHPVDIKHSESYTLGTRRRSWTDPVDPDLCDSESAAADAGPQQPGKATEPSKDGQLPLSKVSPKPLRKSRTLLTIGELKTLPNISYGGLELSTMASNENIPSDYLQPELPAPAVTGGTGRVQQQSVHPAEARDQSLYTTRNGEVHVYSEIPIPPPPPPRPQTLSVRRTRSWHMPKSKLRVSPPLRETSMASRRGVPVPSVPGAKLKRKVHSMRGRIQSPVACQQPFFVRQGSRGDVLISRVVKAYKSKKSSELNVAKGELVKVTNSSIDKDWSLAVTTTGKSGSVKKRHLERVQPVEVVYDVSRPVRNRMDGIITRIAVSGSQQSVWLSPVEARKITITPSSLCSGEVNNLVKFTDYVLCCTNDEPHSSLEIDLHMQRLAKLTGYTLQCHYHGRDGYPRHWRLEGSHNGQTWTELSEEEGDFFQEGHYAHYFEVASPTPCRYFRLVQLGLNSAGNSRLCLSGLELFGFFYSSFGEEMYM